MKIITNALFPPKPKLVLEKFLMTKIIIKNTVTLKQIICKF